MNDLQKAEFEILKAVAQVFRQLNLRYYLVCGSALGAVKYQGFIPWDDDVDLGMPRPDYERFLAEGQALLPPHLFLQTFRTDPHYPQIFAKVRNSNTTYVEKSVSHLDMHHGIGIDIFPLDGYPAETAEQRKLEQQKRKMIRLLSCAFSGGNLKVRLLRVLLKTVGLHRRTAKLLERYENRICRYACDTSDMLCNHGNWQGTLDYFTAEGFGTGSPAMFEGLPVMVPEKYEEYLTQKYGNWREPLPEAQQVGHHYYAVCDPARPYTDYVRQCSDGSVRLVESGTSM